MKITCLAVGKKHDPNLAPLIADYEKRLRSSCDFSWQLVPTSTIQKESESILKFIKDDDVVLLLDERGKLWRNAQLATALQTIQNRSVKRLILIIGGAFGVDITVQRRANYILALSPLVFPHQIVRLIVVEQLYRSYSILTDSGYHHE